MTESDDTPMISDVTLDIECEREAVPGPAVRVADTDWTFQFDFEIESDEELEAFAQAIDYPLVRVSSEDLGWDDKPFIPVDHD